MELQTVIIDIILLIQVEQVQPSMLEQIKMEIIQRMIKFGLDLQMGTGRFEFYIGIKKDALNLSVFFCCRNK